MSSHFDSYACDPISGSSDYPPYSSPYRSHYSLTSRSYDDRSYATYSTSTILPASSQAFYSQPSTLRIERVERGEDFRFNRLRPSEPYQYATSPSAYQESFIKERRGFPDDRNYQMVDEMEDPANGSSRIEHAFLREECPSPVRQHESNWGYYGAGEDRDRDRERDYHDIAHNTSHSQPLHHEEGPPRVSYGHSEQHQYQQRQVLHPSSQTDQNVAYGACFGYTPDFELRDNEINYHIDGEHDHSDQRFEFRARYPPYSNVISPHAGSGNQEGTHLRSCHERQNVCHHYEKHAFHEPSCSNQGFQPPRSSGSSSSSSRDFHSDPPITEFIYSSSSNQVSHHRNTIIRQNSTSNILSLPTPLELASRFPVIPPLDFSDSPSKTPKLSDPDEPGCKLMIEEIPLPLLGFTNEKNLQLAPIKERVRKTKKLKLKGLGKLVKESDTMDSKRREWRKRAVKWKFLGGNDENLTLPIPNVKSLIYEGRVLTLPPGYKLSVDPEPLALSKKQAVKEIIQGIIDRYPWPEWAKTPEQRIKWMMDRAINKLKEMGWYHPVERPKKKVAWITEVRMAKLGKYQGAEDDGGFEADDGGTRIDDVEGDSRFQEIE